MRWKRRGLSSIPFSATVVPRRLTSRARGVRRMHASWQLISAVGTIRNRPSSCDLLRRSEGIAGNHETQRLLDRLLDTDARRDCDALSTIAIIREPQIRTA